jgi:hypothetical protein
MVWGDHVVDPNSQMAYCEGMKSHSMPNSIALIHGTALNSEHVSTCWILILCEWKTIRKEKKILGMKIRKKDVQMYINKVKRKGINIKYCRYFAWGLWRWKFRDQSVIQLVNKFYFIALCCVNEKF